ncbi:unnamed protein product [Bursaphelenchus xylophilus]|nr:unnamed protein product [Bursaphelenchus xylophilus]CAG9093587.1 unnamed protein product [Bursaphelenchus xylophilus]
MLNYLIFPTYLLIVAFITVFPNSHCTMFYSVYSWEGPDDCVDYNMFNNLTKAVYVILGFNLAAYCTISGSLMVQRRQAGQASRQADLKAEQRVLLSTMSSFFSSFVLITGKLILTGSLNDVTLARVAYRALVLISSNVFLFSLVFVNT